MESSEGTGVSSNKSGQQLNSTGLNSKVEKCNGKGFSKGCLSGWRKMEAEAVHHYQVGNYSFAAECYTNCLQQTGIPASSRLSLLHNRSAANLKLKQYALVLEDCNEILRLENGSIKALARKVKALSGEGKFSDARDVALQWQLIDPTNEQVKKELDRLNIILTALQEQDAEEDGLDDGIVITGRREPPEGEESDNDGASSVIPSGSASVSGSAGSGDTEGTMIHASNGAAAASAAGDGETSGMEDDDDLFHCKYCDINFTSNAEFRLHCQSDQHQKTVSSDEEKEWKFRPPPRGFTSDEYSQCPRFYEEGACRFGDQCTQAHSDEELEEWRKRFEYRRQRLMKAKDSEMMQGSSFAEQLMEKWMSAQNPELILTDNAEGINIHVNTDLSVTMTSKKSASSWTFTVTSKISIKRILLLDDANRRYFQVHSITVGPKRSQKSQKIDDSCQEWTNPNFVGTRCSNEKVYRVKVVFKTDIYGTFRQSIVFDFGSEPMLVRELCVDSSPVVDIERVQQDLILNEEGRWDLSSKETVTFEPKPQTLDASDQRLLEKYPPPMAAKFTLSEALLSAEVKKESYKQRMHDLLYIEEMAQFSSISKFNIRTSLHLVNRFLLMPSTVSTAKFAQGGELFARMKLNSDLSEDTSQGRLVLQNVHTVYLAPYVSNGEGNNSSEGPNRIYEALVEEKGKNFIFLRLSAKCVQELNLTSDTELAAEVQFQLNRLPLCEMHEALDMLPNLDIVFPCIASADSPIPWNPFKQWNGNLDTRLNLKQKEAIVAITTDIKRHLPPTLIVGPYGTGKTFTLAHAAKCLLEDQSTRVLICTHSNSAADLYVKDYLDPFVKEGHPDVKPLRVYYRHRWVQTVNPTVLEYCLVSYEGAVGSMFRKPTKEDIESHRVIVCTLSTSRYLFSLGLDEGFFTHILLDEAAQAQECETVMPLVLAGQQTRVVLAGDHMQLGPEIHSDFARERNMHISFLERLYDHYPTNHSCKILLCENYRSHVAIINYTSELFYNKKLVASGKQPRHDIFYPLTFFTARGEDMQHQNSTAFYNNSEVYEIVERVVELQKTWPKSWGALDDSSIGVVSPYYDQVIRIRAELRKKKLFNVSVERVLNVQGKQFRAIFLSTVRTRNTCSSDVSMEEFIDYGFLSNVKLLNTAITRAQSLVAVVGDPVSLCSVGKCRKLWERFIQICNENTSLYGITWTQLRAQLDGVELKKTYVLNPNAPEFIPRRLRHGPFAPLEPVAMGRYGFTFVSQPQQPRGIIAAPAHWMPRAFAPPFRPEVFRQGARRHIYPVPAPAYTAYMTPTVKVTGSPVHLQGGIPTSLSMPPPTLTMAALKGNSPVPANKPPGTGKESSKKKTTDQVAPLSPGSDPGSHVGATGAAPLSSPTLPPHSAAMKVGAPIPPPLHVAPPPPIGMSQLQVGIPMPGGMPGGVPGGMPANYRMSYMPPYPPGAPPMSPHYPVMPPFGVFYPPNYRMKPPTMAHTQAHSPTALKVGFSPPRDSSNISSNHINSTDGAASGGVPSPYQFLPNACNIQHDPSLAGAAAAVGPAAASPESHNPRKYPSSIKKVFGADQQMLLKNPSLQRELCSYIHQIEGEDGVVAFMNYMHEGQMKKQRHGSHGSQGSSSSQPLSPHQTKTSPFANLKPKKEVVSVRQFEDTSDRRYRRKHPSQESSQDGFSSDGEHVSQSQIGNWHDFDATSPPFSQLAGNFRKAVNAGRYDTSQDQNRGKQHFFDQHTWSNKEGQHQSAHNINNMHDFPELVSDVAQPFAVSDMMKFLEEIADDDVGEIDLHCGSGGAEGVSQGAQGSYAFQSMRPGPLYMRGGLGGEAQTASLSNPPTTQTTMSYAGALRSQLSTSSVQPKTTTLTPAQEESRQHLMRLLKCSTSDDTLGASGTSSVTNSSTSTGLMHERQHHSLPWHHPASAGPSNNAQLHGHLPLPEQLPTHSSLLPHPDNSLGDQALRSSPHTPKDVPANPLDLLKNLRIKASPGTQALYQYFS